MKSAADYEREMLDLYKRTTDEKGQSFEGQVCPSTDGHPCRLDDLCKEVLWNKDIVPSDPIRKRASDLNRKERYYSNIYFVANPNEVVLLEYGVKLFNQLIAFQMDPQSEVKNFFDAKTGRNLLVGKTQGATKRDVEYKVTPRINTSQVSHPELLKRLYDLSNVTALIKSGKVKPLYQSKLEKSTEIRVLPSWLGPQSSIFFTMVKYHYNISAEDFALCQAGKINPVANPYGVAQVEQKPYEVIGTAGLNNRGPQTSSTSTAIEAEISQLEQDIPPQEEALPELPICFGMYDGENVKCIECETVEECESERAVKLAKRQAARKLSAPARKI
jgi:hypothetical protein